ncbi:MAG: RDD family protein [Mycobacterium sp.]
MDVLPGFGVIATMVLLALTAPDEGWLWWVFTGVGAATLFAMVLNRLVLPRVTGWTLGRALFGIGVRPGAPNGSGANASIWRFTLRESQIRRLAAWTLMMAAVLCVVAVSLSYAVVYRQERAVDQARAQLAEQGPRIVAQILSYNADTLSEDFNRAQALTTDGYRPRLIAQQQAVRDAGAVTNKYWAASSAVLSDPSVTTDQGSMLLAMQGRRGANPADLKSITATVRAEFDKSADGQWLVANLTVLKKPPMVGAGP